MADVGVAHAGLATVLRRHLFPSAEPLGAAGVRLRPEPDPNAWRNDRAQIVESARDVVAQLQKAGRGGTGAAEAPSDKGVLDSGFFVFRRSFDPQLGGFGGAPKFPRPSVYNFLLRYHARTKNQEALDMVLLTLREMAKGGMHDQLGGGFHRYSVDERWFVPHFEKMLYDQAQLAISYLEAFQITGDPQYAATARGIFDYVLRDMTDPEGGFYSAEDADSVIDPEEPDVKGEGAFYIWTAEEIRRLAPPGCGLVLLPLRGGGERQCGQRSAQRVHRQEHPLPAATIEETARTVRPARGRDPRRSAARRSDSAGSPRRSACGRTSTTRCSLRGTAS